MDREEIVRAIQDAARQLGVERLTGQAFRQQSGISRAAVAKHFDSWSDACAAAGVSCGQPKLIPTPRISEAECISELQRVAGLLGRKALSSKEFDKHARFTSNPVRHRFGTWHNALTQAGLEATTKSEKDSKPPTREACISEMKRVASILEQSYLTQKPYDKYANINSQRVVPVFGSWHDALSDAGLSVSPNYIREIPFEDLVTNFLSVVKELGKIPTLQQLARRTKPVSHTYAGRFGGYDKFKRDSIEYLLTTNHAMSPITKKILEEERLHLLSCVSTQPTKESSPHHQGRTLNFRAFMYAPTCEHDIEQMFGAVAHELGFEIIGNRSAFPDCEARRRIKAEREHYVPCLIEYEFSSLDYKRHKHPLVGCDLVVCWQHNWRECPIEVLELESTIRKLEGWR